MRCLLARALIALLLINGAVAPGLAQNAGPVDDPPDMDPPPAVSVLKESKIDEIVDLLMTSYAADLAMHVAIRGTECKSAEPRCAPLFFAQDVILGPWNFVKLLRVIQETADPEFKTKFQPRDYQTPSLPPRGVLPAELVSLAEYAMEQQVLLYEHLEAWQVTLERYGAAVGQDEPSAVTQRGALDAYSSRVSTAAAAASAASLQFLEGVTPLMRHFASAISVEDEEAAKNDLRDNGFSAELQARFSALGIRQADREALLAEVFAISGETPVDLIQGLAAVASGYDTLADLTTVSVEAAGNLRPVANAGPDQAVPAADGNYASVTLTGTGSTDPGGGALDYVWTVRSMNAFGPKPSIVLPVGTHHIALTVADPDGGTDVDLVTITVADAAAPMITELTARPDILSPSNRQLISVELNVKVTDNDDPAPFCQIVSVGVNEPASEPSGGAAEPDIVLDGALTVLLRAARSGGKANRVYSVTVQCTDKTNHSSIESVFVSVPR